MILHSVYFSAKGTTRLCADCIAEGLNLEKRDYDWLTASESEKTAIPAEDVLLFSMPVYGGFIPGLCAERVRSLIRREKNETGLASWLAVTALLASYLVLLGGISYSEISGWNAILYWYLSGGYPVMTAFEVLAILLAWKEGRRMLRG